jgi:hypothetical protein
VCTLLHAQDNRSIDGFGNNLTAVEAGTAGDLFTRLTSATYQDNIGSPVLDGPNPRVISNELFAQQDAREDSKLLSDFNWVFAQFIKHEISHMVVSRDETLENILVPEDDEFYEPGMVITTKRAVPAEGTGIDVPRAYINQVTSYIDASNVYGSDEDRAAWLRTGIDGKLKMSEGDLLPWNTVDGEFNGEVDDLAPKMLDETNSMGKYFVAGDVRANENPLLISLHTIFLREHNRVCDELMLRHPQWNDERLYQRARKIVGAIMQSITYNEWLPTLGLQVPTYTGYDAGLETKISNEFAVAAFEIASTLVNNSILRMDYDGSEMIQGNIPLADAFYDPENILYVDGIDAYIKGMAAQVQQDLDCKMIDAVRNFSYAEGRGTDRAAVTINKGRDTGLPSYNQMRRELGLPVYRSFDDLTTDQEAVQVLTDLYGSINNCDAWVGLMAEDHLPNSMFGQMTGKIIETQFQLLRDGDRYYYENDDVLLDADIAIIESSTMSDLVLRNTGIDLMQDNVFRALAHENLPIGPDLTPLHLEATVYPNPADDYIVAKFYLDTESVVDIAIVNSIGVTIMNKSITALAGDNVIRMHLDDDVQQGTYHIMLNSRDKHKTLSFVRL